MAQNDKPDMLFTFGEKLRAMDEAQWKKCQTGIGLLLGVGAAACLFLWQGGEGFLPLNTVIALVLVLIVPRIIDNRLQRAFDRGRKVMIIALLVCIGIFVGYTLLTGGVSAFSSTGDAQQVEQQAVEAPQDAEAESAGIEDAKSADSRAIEEAA